MRSMSGDWWKIEQRAAALKRVLEICLLIAFVVPCVILMWKWALAS